MVLGITYHVTLQAIREGGVSRRGAILAMMVFVTLFAGKQVHYLPGIVSNYGNIWYASALFMFAVSVERDGRPFALIILIRTIYWLIVFIVTLWVMANTIAVNKDDILVAAFGVMSVESRGAALWSWTAFAAASWTVIGIMEAARSLPSLLRLSMALFAGQAVDSIIFFPGLVGINEYGIYAAIVGFIIKCTITAILFSILVIDGHVQST